MKFFSFMVMVIGLVLSPSLTAFADTCEGNLEFQEAVSALLCKQEQCPDLQKANAKGITPEMVYYYHCSSDALEIRQTMRDATIENVIFVLQGTRFEKPPTQIPPCECLATLQSAYPECELRQCETKQKPEAENAPKTEIPANQEPGKSATQGPGTPAAGTGFVIGGAGCTLQSLESGSPVNAWLVVLLLGIFPSLRMLLGKK